MAEERCGQEAQDWTPCDRNCAWAPTDYDAQHTGYGCDYLSQTGKSRTGTVYKMLGVRSLTEEARELLRTEEARELLRPENCPCFREREAAPSPASAGKAVDEEEIRRLYEAGETDTAISEALGIVPYRVKRWREDRKLPKNLRPTHQYDWDKALKMYRERKSDREIGMALGCSETTVLKWRKKQGLKAQLRDRRAK